MKAFNSYAAARAQGRRSGFEVRVTEHLDANAIEYDYEEVTIPYEQPAKTRRYTPDLVFPNGVVVELKGIWDSSDRLKIKAVREQHPHVDLRFVFMNSKTRISKQSKTTYAMVCKTLGIKFADKNIPDDWLHEAVNVKSLEALEVLRSG